MKGKETPAELTQWCADKLRELLVGDPTPEERKKVIIVVADIIEAMADLLALQDDMLAEDVEE